jgi:hypothetical protein
MTSRTSPVFTLTPGPAGAAPATLAALSQPILRHQDPAFLALYAETVELLRRAFGTADAPVRPWSGWRPRRRRSSRPATWCSTWSAPPSRRRSAKILFAGAVYAELRLRAAQNGTGRIVMRRQPHDYQKVRDLGLAR